MSSKGRRELVMERFDHFARQVKFSKSREAIVRKAAELASLCDVDVGLLVFSPTGRLTSFASNGRVEDIFLRYLDQVDILQGGCSEELEGLWRNLEHLKREAIMIEKMAKIEALEEKLSKLKRRQYEAERKLSPHVDSITSVRQAEANRSLLIEALRNIDVLKEQQLNQGVKLSPCASSKAPAAEDENSLTMLPQGTGRGDAER